MRELPSLSIFKTNIRTFDLASQWKTVATAAIFAACAHLQLSALYKHFLCYLNIFNNSIYFFKF